MLWGVNLPLIKYGKTVFVFFIRRRRVRKGSGITLENDMTARLEPGGLFFMLLNVFFMDVSTKRMTIRLRPFF